MKKLINILLCVVIFVLSALVWAQIKTVKTNEVSINPYSPTIITDKYVKGVNIYAETVSYKVSFDGTNFVTLPSGTAVNLSGLDIVNFKLYLQGASEVDTGTVQTILMK